MDKTGAIIKFLQKKDMTPKEIMALNCNSTLVIHQIQPYLTFICSLNPSHAFLVASLETVGVVEEYVGTRMQLSSIRGLEYSNII